MFVGLDIGTSGTKAALLDAKGQVLCSHQVSYGFSNTAKGYRELDAEEVWRAAKCCLAKVGHGQEVRTISVSALGEAIVFLDADGRVMAPGITGTDVRGTEELAKLREQFSEHHLVDVTGQNLSVIYSANKILWVKNHRRELYEQAWKILTFQDFILYRLSGECRIDYSMACRTLFFDIDTMDWSEPLLEGMGISREKLAVPCAAGTVVGTLRNSLAEELGLQSGVKIVTGTHDHICNAIGSGVCEAGDCANTVGTTEGLTAVVRRSELTTENIEKYQISCEPFAVPGLYNTVAWNNTSGVLLRWFATEFVKEKRPEQLLETFAELNGSMKEEPTSLLVLPHFSGAATPYMDTDSLGAILGLTLDTRREDIYKALMEGANLELALILESLLHAGMQPRKIIATGGALSPQLLQIKADVLGLPVWTVKNRQTGTLGGAMLGAVADQKFSTVKEAAEAMVMLDAVYEPDAGRSAVYKEKKEIYRRLYPSICEISHAMIAMRK